MEYVLITGASNGLGRSLARTINDEDKVLILIARNQFKLNKLKSELNKERNQKILAYPFDLSNFENVDDLMNNIILQFNHKDDFKITLINNASTIHPITTVDLLEEKDIRSNLTINILSPALIISKLIKFANLNSRQLKIINISSGAYKQPIGSWSLYCTSKAAIQMYLEVTLLENNSNSNLKILSIDPGVMDTEMQESIRNSESTGFSKKNDFIDLYRENKLRNVDSVSKVIKENFIDDWNVNGNFMKLDNFFESK
ncbi:SDR family NAD(P)-dependent oxidoreductase [Soehngenia longivitae]|uniref:SDR family NAD(P)-dependent oxidoreductase n=1 Tax=Soehngenia longivitae TaxID=2562294 RepID=A0A4Z0D7G6_9FIRM|nr:SDR family NAD(P)-dependent oxidoreductase [Soehngenia longivitae]TFZ40799.1 SDR family NAD(P)-dependent oxidoreductase [Soehngenia longivitae]